MHRGVDVFAAAGVMAPEIGCPTGLQCETRLLLHTHTNTQAPHASSQKAINRHLISASGSPVTFRLRHRMQINPPERWEHLGHWRVDVEGLEQQQATSIWWVLSITPSDTETNCWNDEHWAPFHNQHIFDLNVPHLSKMWCQEQVLEILEVWRFWPAKLLNEFAPWKKDASKKKQTKLDTGHKLITTVRLDSQSQQALKVSASTKSGRIPFFTGSFNRLQSSLQGVYTDGTFIRGDSDRSLQYCWCERSQFTPGVFC